MVWLGGPLRGGGRTKGIRLHDAPPGYRPPARPPETWLGNVRRDRVLLYVAAVLLALGAVVVLVVMVLMIAGFR
jgi:hypothetical protein